MSRLSYANKIQIQNRWCSEEHSQQNNVERVLFNDWFTLQSGCIEIKKPAWFDLICMCETIQMGKYQPP